MSETWTVTMPKLGETVTVVTQDSAGWSGFALAGISVLIAALKDILTH